MKNNIYYIDTKNRHKQILIFASYKKAFNWMKNATKLEDDEIKKEIKKAVNISNNYLSIII